MEKKDKKSSSAGGEQPLDETPAGNTPEQQVKTSRKKKRRSNVDPKNMPFTEHLEELRRRLFKIIGSVVGFGLVSYIFSNTILAILTRPNPSVELQVLKPTGGFLIHMKVSFFAGVILSIPVIIYQFWEFIAPGLFPKERRYILPIILFTVICFVIGALFAYFVVVPFGLRFLLGFATETMVMNWTIDEYISFVTMLMIVFGIVFELPMVSLFLGKIGVISPALMVKYRRHAIFGAVVFGAILTPPDFITQLALAIPLWILYEISIILIKIFCKKTPEEDLLADDE